MARIDEHDVCEQFCDRYAFGLITHLREAPFEKGDISALNALFNWLPLH